MSDARARDLGVRPLARIVSTGVTGLEPEYLDLKRDAKSYERIEGWGNGGVNLAGYLLLRRWHPSEKG